MSPVPVAPPVPAHRTEVADRLAAAGPGRPAGGAERKNDWQLAEVNGDADPYGIQYLLNRARWSVAAARTALGGYVQAPRGDLQAVGIIDETAFLKKGPHSAGVARQYSGTAGRPSGGLPGLCRGAGLHAAGRETLPAQGLGQRAGAAAGRRPGPGHALCHQAATDPTAAGLGRG